MNAVEFNNAIMQPALETATGIIDIPRSRAADQMLLTIAGQESAWTYRYQLVAGRPGRKGPARGFWQFERNGGVAGVMQHHGTAHKASALIDARNLPHDRRAVWEALEDDDVLAVGFARLLLWSDPRALPTTQSTGWQYYIRNWRPGKPHPAKWPGLWQQSHRALEA